MPVDATLLEGVALFRTLDDADRAGLASTMDLQPIEAGTTLFHQGDAGNALFVVLQGGVELFVKDHAGQEIVLHRVGHKEAFGELSLLDGRPRSATARVVEDGRLLVLDREDLVSLVRKSPDLALDILAHMSAETRRADELLRSRVARNVNEEVAEQLSVVDRVADWAAWFSGSVPFLALHIAWFVIWIWINTTGMPGVEKFDPYPFGLLTMIVSLEAIFLSCLVLISQNRQASKDRVRSDVEYEVNVKAELEVAQLHEKLDRLSDQIAERLGRIERKGS